MFGALDLSSDLKESSERCQFLWNVLKLLDLGKLRFAIPLLAYEFEYWLLRNCPMKWKKDPEVVFYVEFKTTSFFCTFL